MHSDLDTTSLTDDVTAPITAEIAPPGEAAALRIVQTIDKRVHAAAKTLPARHHRWLCLR
jgi:hypothetical protein